VCTFGQINCYRSETIVLISSGTILCKTILPRITFEGSDITKKFRRRKNPVTAALGEEPLA